MRPTDDDGDDDDDNYEVLELTVGFETNLVSNPNRKTEQICKSPNRTQKAI